MMLASGGAVTDNRCYTCDCDQGVTAIITRLVTNVGPVVTKLSAAAKLITAAQPRQS